MGVGVAWPPLVIRKLMKVGVLDLYELCKYRRWLVFLDSHDSNIFCHVLLTMAYFFLRGSDFPNLYILSIFYLVSFVVTSVFLRGSNFLNSRISNIFCLMLFAMIDFFMWVSFFDSRALGILCLVPLTIDFFLNKLGFLHLYVSNIFCFVHLIMMCFFLPVWFSQLTHIRYILPCISHHDRFFLTWVKFFRFTVNCLSWTLVHLGKLMRDILYLFFFNLYITWRSCFRC